MSTEIIDNVSSSHSVLDSAYIWIQVFGDLANGWYWGFWCCVVYSYLSLSGHRRFAWL